MFASAEKLYVCCIKTREREKGGEKEARDRLEAGKKLSTRFELLVGLALNRLLTVKSTAMKVRFANGAKNKFAAFLQTQRNQIQISFVISWEKFLGWNFLPFNRSSRAFGGYHLVSSEEVSCARFVDLDIFTNWSEFRLRSEPMFAPKPASLLQDLMRACHKRAHIPFEHGGCVKK